MITFSNGGRLVQSLSELPNLVGANELFLDTEWNNVVHKKQSVNFYKYDRVCGISVTTDTQEGAWYVPIRHVEPGDQGDPRHDDAYANVAGNLPVDNVLSWANDIVRSCKRWINHNIKGDMHGMWLDGVEFNSEVVCTLTLSKIIDSDRTFKGGYGLDALSTEWLDENIAGYNQRIQAYLDNLKGARRYSRVPVDIMGEYACQDVITNRRLWANIQRRLPEQCKGVWDTEIKMTPVLWDMEHLGLRVDPQELQIKEYSILWELTQIEAELHKLCDMPVDPSSSASCYEVLCGKYNLPVLSYTEEGLDEDGEPAGNPSFDKDAMASYLLYPAVAEDPKLTHIVKQIQYYKKRNTLLTFFVRPYQEHHVNGVMHPDYNQAVRTARLSCKRPNAQQLSKEAKELVHPEPGCAFLDADYSQVEFRLMAHYLNDHEVVRAYNDNPDTDFHEWVAKMTGMPRRPAKNVNFCIGFGGGKKKVINMIATNMDVVGNLGADVQLMIDQGQIKPDQRKLVFEMLCQRRGEELYAKYHEMLPSLRECTRRAALRTKTTGYVFNAYGRWRRLPEKAAFRSFNAIIQSTAADLMKERTIALSPRYNSMTRQLGIDLRASVHDATLSHGDKDMMRDPAVIKHIITTLEDTTIKFRVPIRASCNYSQKDWRSAAEGAMPLDRTGWPAPVTTYIRPASPTEIAANENVQCAG